MVEPHAHPFSAPARPAATGGRRVGVLLSHGFTGSPASMRGWAEFLAERGYAVEVPRLPGHGTTWQEMNRTTWTDWSDHLARTYAELAARSDAVVVAGLSMGGGLALELAAREREAISGVVLVNPAVASSNRLLLAAPALQRVIGSIPGITNDIAKPGMDEHGYTRTPVRAAVSMSRGWKSVRAALGDVTAPVLLFRSVTDHVVDPSSGRIIRERVASVEERLLERSFHVATLDYDAERIHTESAEFIAAVTAP